MTGTKRAENLSKAYRQGWVDGRYEPIRCFTENHRLAEWQMASDRLDYYRGHRAGAAARRCGGDLLEAS